MNATIGRRTALKLLPAAAGSLSLPMLLSRRAFAEQAPFKIGVVASLTGPAAPFFREYVDAFRAYLAGWNRDGGVNGRPVQLDVFDDESGAVQAVSGYKRLASDADVKVAWVGNPGAAGLAMKAIAGELKLPIVSGGALDALARPAEPYFFKIAPINSYYAKLFYGWVRDNGMKRVGLLLGNDAYGQGEAQSARELTGPLGLQIVALETFSPSDTNFGSQLVRLRSAGPDIIYVGASGAAGILVYKQIRQFNLKPPLCLMLAAITDAFFQAIGGPGQADGLLTPGLLGMLGTKAQGESGILYAALSDAIGRPASLGNALGWDIGIVTRAAIANSDGTRDGIRAALDRTAGLPGINGPINFSPENHVGQDTRGMAMLKLSGGAFVYAT